MKQLFLLLFGALLYNKPLHSQVSQDSPYVYKKTLLTKKDVSNGVSAKYNFLTSDKLVGQTLTLYKDHSYLLEQGGDAGDYFSKGKWIQKNGVLELVSSLDTANLPIKLIYRTSVADSFSKNLKVEMVQNLKGESLPDAFININSDTVLCTPFMGQCIGSYTSIDSIRVVFENRFTSRWIKIEPREFVAILPVLQLDFAINRYMYFNSMRFRLGRDSLTMID